jgi:hypothetical protein
MLHRHGIQIGYGERVDDFFKIARQTNWAIGLWLDLYLLHKVDNLLAINVNLSPNCHYKPFAIRAKAFYDLALEIYILAASDKKPFLKPIIDTNLTPQYWMLLCESYICEAALKNSYYSDQPQNQQVKGKIQLYKSARSYYSLFNEENLASLQFLPVPESQKSLTWIQLLECIGAAIAKEDSEFRQLHWLPYTATQLRVLREVKNSNSLKVLKINPRDKLEVVGRGNRGRDKRKRNLNPRL